MKKNNMSSFVQDWNCDKCKSENAFYENFKDSETGYIFECNNCKYMEVYREDTNTGEIIEDYKGYDHYYNNKQANK